MISLNDVEVYIGENLLFPTTYTVAKSVKKSHSPRPLQEYLYTCVLSLEFTCRFLYN